MTAIVAYWSFLLITLGVSWALGATDTRRAIVMIVLATMGTLIVQMTLDQMAALASILAIDALLLAYFVALALRSVSFWPMWFSAMCGLGVLSNATAFVFRDANPSLYQDYAGFWAIPALLTLSVGTVLDSRAGIGREIRQKKVAY